MSITLASSFATYALAVQMWIGLRSHARHRDKSSPRPRYVFFLMIAFSAMVGVCRNDGLNASPALRSHLSERIWAVLYMLGQFHYRPLPLDEALGEAVRHDFLYNLDGGGLFFLEEDERSLLSVPPDLQQIRPGQSVPFFEMSVVRFRQRIAEVLQLLDSMEKNPIPWNADTVEFIPREEVRFTSSAAERSHRWSKLIRHQMLTLAYFRTAGETGKKDAAAFEQGIKGGEAELRTTVIRREKKRILEILNHRDGFENNMASLFLNSIAGRFDPHSLFLSGAQRRSLEALLSARSFSYGISLGRTRGGEIRIERLLPGGPAWKSSRINSGDIVLEVVYPDEGNRSVDLADLGLEEATAAVNDVRSARIILVLRKPAGLQLRVPLLKEKLSVEENTVTGFVLDGKKRIGYIYLPAFYTDLENRDVAVCANDVAKEILKLKREKIDGLMLDLRGNGGGSVNEAVHLAGLFIDQGPIVIRSSRGEKPVVMKDPSRGTVYDGPLVVMVNGQSASASEFFVKALSDHNRAIIVGQRTYGKGSGQVILPAVSDRSQIQAAMQRGDDGLDFLKVTTDIFYDLTGQTHQASGIQPDVLLPDPLPEEGAGERSSPNVILASPIAKKASFEKLRDLPRADLARKSGRRSEDFEPIMSLARPLRRALLPGKVSLNPTEFFSGMQDRMKAFEGFERALGSGRLPFEARVTSYNAELDRVDPYHRDLSIHLIEKLSHDLYLNEAYRIAVDLVKASE